MLVHQTSLTVSRKRIKEMFLSRDFVHLQVAHNKNTDGLKAELSLQVANSNTPNLGENSQCPEEKKAFPRLPSFRQRSRVGNQPSESQLSRRGEASRMPSPAPVSTAI